MTVLEKPPRWRPRLSLLFGTAVILALSWSSLRAALWRNAGWGSLNHYLADQGGSLLTAADQEAGEHLRRAVAAGDASSAWRGIGYILAAQGRPREAAAAWQEAGEMAAEFVRWGHWARKLEDYATAVAWYEWATILAQDEPDPWYYLGRSYEALGQLAEAEAAYRQGLEKPGTNAAGRGSFYQRLGYLVTQTAGTPDWTTLLTLADQALAAGDFEQAWMVAEAYNQRATALRMLGRPREAIAAYREVLARRPADYAVHLFLGDLLWTAEGEAEAAEQYLLAAQALRPERKEAYRNLGLLYQQTSRTAEAIAMYREVLARDPDDALASQRLAELDD